MEPSLKNLTNNFGALPAKSNEYLQSLGKPHIDSFNHFVNHGLDLIENALIPSHFDLDNGTRIMIGLSNLSIQKPGTIKSGRLFSPTFPSECRQRKATYSGRLVGQVTWSVNGIMQPHIEKDFGSIPIMVKSNRCNLSNLSPTELVGRGEHESEWGGYFIVKGNERLVRMLLTTRRNYPIAVTRRSWKQRVNMFSEKGIQLRCVAEDQTSTNNVLHFVNDGSAKLMFNHNRLLFYVPVCLALKCLMNVTDHFIFKKLMDGMEDDSYYRSCVVNMLQISHSEGLNDYHEARAFVGKTFRRRFTELPEWATDEEVCDAMLRKCIAIHLKTMEEKFELLVFMTQKLFTFVQGKCCDEGVDAVMFQEVCTGGQIYQQVLKDRLQRFLIGLKFQILKRQKSPRGFTGSRLEMSNVVAQERGVDRIMENFLATGNVRTMSPLGVMQDSGLTIVAENINRMRYMSHFKSVHRGSFFVEMRTTEARQLLPDAWGFICPVHTPDGSPCGLLNHLSKYCELSDAAQQDVVENLPLVLQSLGVVRHWTPGCSANTYPVVVDGSVIGRLRKDGAKRLVKSLRVLKIEGKQVPKTMEVVWVPLKEVNAQYPGIFIFTGPARLMRPVRHLGLDENELIGTFEQVYMDICIKGGEAYPERTTHQELSSTAFLSNLACLIPMPDCNQSPRNMYQCQMGKQTMGTPCHTWHLQSETKLYRLLTPAAPLFRPQHHDVIGMDDFPMGTNAIVAVISYTGYDMEDAMIINKSSYERGFAHGSILKSELIDLEHKSSYFERDPSNSTLSQYLDTDGLPHPGSILEEETPICCFYDGDQSKYVVKKFHGKEKAFVDSVRQCIGTSGELPRALINIRVPRNPTVGDKFASRAGQKGICSQLWPAEDLPFTDLGMVPDIVFNPHGFPSRMTIAMMIELMAGKSGALHGLVHDATPFRFNEDKTAIDYFSKLLVGAGYNYHGTERMYSGVDGRELKASIFFGVVYYQRLRHMVLDKWQVRSTGPIDSLTMQPIKGRRRGGGVRFGEMERDSLISHGASFLLSDRLFECSDRHTTLICKSCNSQLSSYLARHPKTGARTLQCRHCEDGGKVEPIDMPYIFYYLLVQLASVNINVKVLTRDMKEVDNCEQVF